MGGEAAFGTWIQLLTNYLGNAEANARTDVEKARLHAILDKFKNVQQPSFDTGPLEAEAGRMDPDNLAIQRRALASLREIQDSGGLTLDDKAAQNSVLNDVARREAAGRNAIQARMDARGTGSSGANLAMQLSNQQSAANRAQDVGMKTAGSAQRRYIDSILKQGQMAANMTDQDYRARQARDVMNQYNQKNRNTYAQQRYANEAANIAAQAGATQPLVTLGVNDANADRTAWAGYGAAGSKLTEDLLRDRDTYESGEPTGYGDAETRNRIDDEFENR